MTKIHPSAIVDKGAQIGEGVEIGPFSVIGPHVRIGDRTKVMSHVVLDGHTTVGADCSISPFACIGTETQDLKYRGAVSFVEIGDHTVLREYVTVNSATEEGQVTRVGSRCFITAYCHVAHACSVGNEVIMSSFAALAGHVHVEDRVIIGGMTAVHQFVRIGTMCMIGGCSRITQDCPPYMMVVGNPAEVHGPNTVGLRRRNVPAETRQLLKDAYKILYRKGLATGEAVRQIHSEVKMTAETRRFVEFVESSERGILR